MKATLKPLAAAVVVTLTLAGCASSGNTDSSNTPAPAAQNSDSPAVSNDYALDYTGGAGGEADPSKPPLVIGYINQEGAAPSFPEATVGMDAAVAYANKELGGAGGRPVELLKCFVKAEEDGQRCATQMANDDNVSFVVLGVLTVGNKAIYSLLNGRKPILSGNPSTNDDFTAKDTFAYTSGTPGIIAGMATFVATMIGPVKTVAVLHGDNAAGKAAAEQIFKPLVGALGVTDVKLVPVSDTATAPDLASAIQAGGGRDADVVVPFLAVPGCIATYDALKSLGINPTVVATGLCFGTPMTTHLEDVGSSDQVPDGWYFAAFGYSYFQPDEESGMSTYLAKVRQYGPEDVEYTGFAGYLFATQLTAIKLINEIGVDNVTSDSMREALGSFQGPMMLSAGPMECGYSQSLPALCGSEMGVEQYKDGVWLPSALATDGGAISVKQALAG